MDGLQFVHVRGTSGTPFLVGAGEQRTPVEVRDFQIGTAPVTESLWMRIMGWTRTPNPQPHHPVTDVSWHDITGPDGFLERLNASHRLTDDGGFRLPLETEWEYAARGGPHWRDDYRFSGSNDPRAVAWFGPRWTTAHEFASRLLGWRIVGRYGGLRGRTGTHPVATKAPNQLGIYDMSGNVWEWCEDACDNGEERRLRGGCHHNWDLHCTVSWRYGIAPDAHDGCIGFRLAADA